MQFEAVYSSDEEHRCLVAFGDFSSLRATPFCISAPEGVSPQGIKKMDTLFASPLNAQWSITFIGDSDA